MTIKTTLTKRELADGIAEQLGLLHTGEYGDRAVGLNSHGELANCFEGGCRLAAVLVEQAGDVDSYGGGAMTEEDLAGVADCFYGEWLDEYNAKHDEDEQIEWAEKKRFSTTHI